MSIRAVAAATGLLACLSGCGMPVPADRPDYVGEWNGPDRYPSIDSGGHVEYKRQRGSSSTSVSGPIQAFKKMVVDGVELTRVP